MRVFHLVNYGFYCPFCSINTSYPEKFMLSYLTVKGIPFDYQVKLPDNARRIDFKIHLNNQTYMLETHGRAHYDKNLNWYEGTKKSDKIKQQFCKENNLHLIELNCSESDFYFIKRQVDNCEILPSISTEEEFKIIKLIQDNQYYPTKDVIEDNSKGLNLNQISEKHNLTPRIVEGILKRNGKENVGNKKKTICITTGDIYKSTQEASEKTGIPQSSISNCCRGVQNTAGKLKWKYI